MAVVKSDPLGKFRVMQEQMSRLLNKSRENVDDEPLEQGEWKPPVDIWEDRHSVIVKMELPEMDEQDIGLRIEDNVLIIEGERRLEHGGEQQSYLRVERAYGGFRRSFALPVAIDQERIRASCERGVLKVVLPKKEEGMTAEGMLPEEG